MNAWTIIKQNKEIVSFGTGFFAIMIGYGLWRWKNRKNLAAKKVLAAKGYGIQETKKDGTKYWVEPNVKSFADKDGITHVRIVYDPKAGLTAEEMEKAGRFVGGIFGTQFADGERDEKNVNAYIYRVSIIKKQNG